MKHPEGQGRCEAIIEESDFKSVVCVGATHDLDGHRDGGHEEHDGEREGGADLLPRCQEIGEGDEAERQGDGDQHLRGVESE
jgi:hypothetical protein